MKRERPRSRAIVTAVRPELMRGALAPRSARPRDRREPPTYGDGLDGFLVALPRMFAPRAGGLAPGGREIAHGHARSMFGDDAA